MMLIKSFTSLDDLNRWYYQGHVGDTGPSVNVTMPHEQEWKAAIRIFTAPIEPTNPGRTPVERVDLTFTFYSPTYLSAQSEMFTLCAELKSRPRTPRVFLYYLEKTER